MFPVWMLCFLTLVCGTILGAAYVNWRLSAKLHAMTVELADAKARMEERESTNAEVDLRAKIIAQEVLQHQSKQLTETNQTNLSNLLSPLKTQFEQFTREVTGLKETNQKDSSALGERIKLLLEAQQKISNDAQNLASALKGDNKIMGDWGEVVLERILEVSGLTRDREFFVQQTYSAIEGQLQPQKPDVVIQLPEDRYLVIDSKVSLKAYEEYFHCTDETTRHKKLKEHVSSIRTHINGLSQKNYQGIHGDRSPDFVIMFIPIEPAFLLATGSDEQLWSEGWNRHVLLVSPNTLLFVLRTVENLWRQDRVGRNAAEIAKRGAHLYDKVRSFVETMLDIKRNLESASRNHEAALRQLSEGPGSVVRQIEMLRDLGVKPVKGIPEEMLRTALPDKEQ